MTKLKLQRRRDKFMPGGIPKWIHVYDNDGRSADRFTCVFTGRYRARTGGVFWYLGMSSNPFHPQGVGMSGESKDQIDYPTYSHLGKKVKFKDLPDEVKKCIIQQYELLWDLK